MKVQETKPEGRRRIIIIFFLYYYQTPSAEANSNYGLTNMSEMAYKYLEILDKIVSDAESGNKLPRASLGNIVGNLIKTTGVVLEKDNIPPLDKAFYLQVKKELAPNLGVTAWYLRSVGDKSHTILAANGTGNDAHTFDQLANVIGGGYVPAKNWLLELFYTFDAKSTNQRDTLHGPENFKLGNYARAQITYRF